METLSDRKRRWRRLAADMFSLVPRAARAELDEALAERVWEFAAGSGAKTLLGFSALPDEPDLAPFFRRWLAGGGVLALPVWPGGSDMTLRRVANLDRDLRPGRGGILEPVAGLPEVAPRELDAVVTPGRFFSEGCDRLGRGAGCYDALLRQCEPASVGAAYDFQVLPEIPAGPDDVPLDAIVTPTRTVRRVRDRGFAKL